MKIFTILLLSSFFVFTGIFSFDPPPLPGSEEELPPLSPVIEEGTEENESDDQIPFYDKELLPENYVVYTDGKSMVVNQKYPGLKKVILPTKNIFKGAPGCYVACYSRDKKGSIYPVGGGIYVMGQIRVPGEYRNNICRPKNYETADISALDYFKSMCNEHIKNCVTKTSCWTGGSTYWH